MFYEKKWYDVSVKLNYGGISMSTVTQHENTKNFVTAITQSGQTLTIGGQLTTALEIQDLILILNDTATSFLSFSKVTISKVEKNNHNNCYFYSCHIKMDDIAQRLFKQHIMNIQATVQIRAHFVGAETPYLIAFAVKEDFYPQLIRTLFTYQRMSTKRLYSFRLNESGFMELTSQLYKKEAASKIIDRRLVAPLIKLFSPAKDIILVGGRSPRQLSKKTFQAFLSLLAENKDAYYILEDSHAAFPQLVARYPERIIAFASDEYVHLFYKAKYLLSAGVPDLFYPSQNRALEKVFSCQHYLLPDAMLGLSHEYYTINQASPYAQNIASIWVHSRTEARFADKDLHFKKETIKLITSLTETTELLESSTEIKKENQLLFLPYGHMWQKESLTDNSLQPFYHLINEPRLQKFLTDYQLEATMILPARFLDSNLSLPNCNIYTDKQLTQCSSSAKLIITDYHPLALDFSLHNHPVIFYRPQEEKVGQKALSHPYENDLPGELVDNLNNLFYLLDQVAANKFKNNRQQQKKVDALRYHAQTSDEQSLSFFH